ncbi:lasso RiPP family leader peptide-containing protein [Streptomyces decoyicus]|uniref:Lasso RiPP family leader peptide-containing protein n=1 Tax=Streptomyces decoyicus TaxID=249567 RepID=A0ABZ1F8Q8_9ACTN|nr:lasso RiPP family leader peptide-containing protein [Streptomyces decoyicus]WSB66596.1 lasso RiPP family leader peptide-containing protein [Streptomyces decoyicus]
MENMETETAAYEVPELVELGDYDDLTRGVGIPLADFFIHFD